MCLSYDASYDASYDSSYDLSYDASYDASYDSSYDASYDASYDSCACCTITNGLVLDSSYDASYDECACLMMRRMIRVLHGGFVTVDLELQNLFLLAGIYSQFLLARASAVFDM